MTYPLISITGPSGIGKTTLLNNLFDVKHQLISFTTRQKRSGEIEGKDYYFIDKEDLKQHKVIEQDEYNGNYYGLFQSELDKLEKSICGCVLTKNGYLRLKELVPVIPIFVTVNDVDKVKVRLAERDDTVEHLQARLQLFNQENQNKAFFENEPNSIILDTSNNTPDETLQQAIHQLKKQLR